MAPEDVDSGGGHGRAGEDWRAALHGAGDRADHAEFDRCGFCLGVSWLRVSRPTAGDKPRPTVSAIGENSVNVRAPAGGEGRVRGAPDVRPL